MSNVEYDRTVFDTTFKAMPLTMNNLFVFMLRNTSEEQGIPAVNRILASYLVMLHALTMNMIDAWPEMLKTPKPEFTGYIVSLAYNLGSLAANTRAVGKEAWKESVKRWANMMLRDDPKHHAVVMELINHDLDVDKLYVAPEQTEQP
jgi:predicted secreted protein